MRLHYKSISYSYILWSDLTSGPSAQEVVRYGRVEHVVDGRVTGVAVLRRLPELSVVPAHDLDPGIAMRN